MPHFAVADNRVFCEAFRMASNPFTKSAAQTFPQPKKMIGVARAKEHPAVKAATGSFAALHGMKFAANAGRGFKKKAQA